MPTSLPSTSLHSRESPGSLVVRPLRSICLRFQRKRGGQQQQASLASSCLCCRWLLRDKTQRPLKSGGEGTFQPIPSPIQPYSHLASDCIHTASDQLLLACFAFLCSASHSARVTAASSFFAVVRPFVQEDIRPPRLEISFLALSSPIALACMTVVPTPFRRCYLLLP